MVSFDLVAANGCSKVIGGAACDAVMKQEDGTFRVTKDLDIVLCVEALSASYENAFWEFIQQGEYEHLRKSSQGKQFYRFERPRQLHFPAQIELFSRVPDALEIVPHTALTPIPIDEEVASLSAILLNENYYRLIQAGKVMIEGLPVVKAEYLIPLKARAWLDLSARKAQGQDVDSKAIKKHKNDIYRLYNILAVDTKVPLPEELVGDLASFMDQIESTDDLEHTPFGTPVRQILTDLRNWYSP